MTQETYDMFAVLRVREADSNRLINEKYIGIRVPAFWMEFGGGVIDYPTGS